MTREIYYNGTIITMEEPLTAEALLVENGRIQAVGSVQSIMEMKTNDTTMINLDGQTLMPAFIDGHSHLTAFSSTIDLVSLADAKNFPDIIEKMQTTLQDNKLTSSQWLTGFGYDHNFLEEKKHPDKLILDKISTEQPICITHASGHIAIVNSKALALLGIDEQTLDPSGGLIGRMVGSQEPNGYLEENGFFQYAAVMTKPDLEQRLKSLEKAQQVYLQYGITTVQDGKIGLDEWRLLESMAESNQLKVDAIGYLDILKRERLLKKVKPYLMHYRNHLKIGGYKIFLDGSPQGRTAWMSQPYLPEEEGYTGYPIYQSRQVEEMVEIAYEDDLQILAHCNGDAAAEQFIHAVEAVQEEQDYSGDIRPVMIHAQLVRKDQLIKMRELEMIPSYFVAHTYYWGDIHRQNFGDKRAFNISPARDTILLGMPYTFHQDTPVIWPNMFETIWCAVNRISKSGVVIGEEQRISVLDALKAVTIYGAFQYFEEKDKGSIKAGKRADLIIIDKNPLEIPKDELKNIVVLETIKDGYSVYKMK